MREDGDASDKPLDIAVLSRMKQFQAMNKLKKVALKVSYHLSSFLLLLWKQLSKALKYKNNTTSTSGPKYKT